MDPIYSSMLKRNHLKLLKLGYQLKNSIAQSFQPPSPLLYIPASCATDSKNIICRATLQRSHKWKFNRTNWLFSQSGDTSIGCSTEPVDRIGMHRLDPDVTMASTPGRCSSGRSHLRWLETLKCRCQRKGRGINVASHYNIVTSGILIGSISYCQAGE